MRKMPRKKNLRNKSLNKKNYGTPNFLFGGLFFVYIENASNQPRAHAILLIAFLWTQIEQFCKICENLKINLTWSPNVLDRKLQIRPVTCPCIKIEGFEHLRSFFSFQFNRDLSSSFYHRWMLIAAFQFSWKNSLFLPL